MLGLFAEHDLNSGNRVAILLEVPVDIEVKSLERKVSDIETDAHELLLHGWLTLHLAADWHWPHSHVHDSWHSPHWHSGEHLRTSHHLLRAALESMTRFWSVLLVASPVVLEKLRLSSGHLLLHERLVLGAHRSWSSSHHVLLLRELLSLSAHHWLSARSSLSWCWWLIRLLWLLLICVHFLMINNLRAAKIF